MKKEAKDILDKEILKGKVKLYATFAVSLLIFIALVTVFNPVSSTSLIVSPYKYTAKQTDSGNKSTMWVKLNNNSTIKVEIPESVPLQDDKQVEIIQTTTLIGVSTYKFSRYVNKIDNHQFVRL